ncbi:MAG: hypothetical protein JXB10_01400 [Pirellulales bacterium]|nr:hypothetical protein [Pirellulales bacterium]
MGYDVKQEDIISLQCRRIGAPHVVILGAGASVAACPNGDALGRRLPMMANLVEILELNDFVSGAGYDPTIGFESLYSRLHVADPQPLLVQEIENRVEDYFNRLILPRYPTIYDLLLLSLRGKDAIFTFNWDPFLADAYDRIAEQVPSTNMPNIFHLHGNVRVAFCEQCLMAMPKIETCPTCGAKLNPTRLLYPVEKKDYAEGPYMVSQWKDFREFIGRALIITIFGYSAPMTDQEAMTTLKAAWKDGESHKLIHRLEIIDIRDQNELARQWSSFSIFHHYDIRRSFHESLLARYPRRSCEALFQSNYDGKVVEPIAWAGNLEGMGNAIDELVAYEYPKKSEIEIGEIGDGP